MTPAPDHHHTVMFIDDDADALQAMQLLLETQGFAVVAVNSGARALGALANGMRPCLILLDMWMPEMDGWEVWNRIRTTPAWAAIPVVPLSASSEIVRAHQEGIEGALAKPVDANDWATDRFSGGGGETSLVGGSAARPAIVDQVDPRKR